MGIHAIEWDQDKYVSQLMTNFPKYKEDFGCLHWTENKEPVIFIVGGCDDDGYFTTCEKYYIN